MYSKSVCALHIGVGGRGAPVHGLRIDLREGGAGWAGLSSVRPSVSLLVTLEKVPKGLQIDQETCIAVVKRAKVESYSEVKYSSSAQTRLKSEFGITSEKYFSKIGIFGRGIRG